MATYEEQILAEYEKRQRLKQIQAERAALAEQIAQKEAEVQKELFLPTMISSVAQGLGPLGTWSDEMASAAEAALSDRTYAEIQAEKERQLAAGREAYPGMSLGTEVGTSLLSGFGLKKLLQTGAQGAALLNALKNDKVRRAANVAEAITIGTGAGEMGEKTEAGATTGLVSAGLDVAPGIIARAANRLGVSGLLQKAGQKLGRESLGLQFKDYLSAGLTRLTDDASGNVYKAALESGGEAVGDVATFGSKLEGAANDLISKGALPKSRDPQVLSKAIDDKLGLLSMQREKAVNNYDSFFDNINQDISAKSTKAQKAAAETDASKLLDAQGRPIAAKAAKPTKAKFLGADFPDLKKWEDEIEATGGALSREDKDELIGYARKLKNQHDEVATGRLKHLLELKQQVGDNAFRIAREFPASKKQEMYNRLYRKLQDATTKELGAKDVSKLVENVPAGEKTADMLNIARQMRDIGREIQDVTGEISKYKTLEAPIKYQIMREPSQKIGSTLANLINTTGGVAAPAILGATLASSTGGEGDEVGNAVLGAALGLGYKRLIGGKEGQRDLGSYLTGAARTLKAGQLPSVLPTTLEEALRQGIIRQSTADIMPEAQATELISQPAEMTMPDMDDRILAEYERRKALRAAPKTAATPYPKITNDQELRQFIDSRPAIIRAIIEVESKGNPSARSKRGAGGLMQVMEATAKELGIKDRFDPIQNVEGGTKYFNQQMDKFKDLSLALGAYNWGPGNVRKAINKMRAKGLKPTWQNIVENTFVPLETQKYVSKVLALEAKYRS